MMNIFNHKGQYIAEYAIIFSIVLAAIIVMQTYVKRGLQGRYRDATDRVIFALGGTKGFEPRYNESEITTTVTQKRDETVNLGGSEVTTINNSVEREGTQWVLPAEAE